MSPPSLKTTLNVDPRMCFVRLTPRRPLSVAISSGSRGRRRQELAAVEFFAAQHLQWLD